VHEGSLDLAVFLREIAGGFVKKNGGYAWRGPILQVRGSDPTRNEKPRTHKNGGRTKGLYFTLAKIIAKVNRAKVSMKTRPRMKAN
jgi:hypothetical protein